MDSEHIKKALELAFTAENETDGIRYVTTEELKKIGEGADPVEVMTVSVPNPGEEAAYAEKVLRAYGLVPVADLHRREHASFGGLEFTNDPAVVDAQYPDEINSETAGALDDDEEEALAAPVAQFEIASDGSIVITSPGSINIRTKRTLRAETARDSLETVPDENKLKVINNSEMMKMANKIFDMISPGDDKSNYAAFLFNLDDFFLVHRPDGGAVEEDDEDDDGPEERNPLAGGIEQASSKDIAYLVKAFGNIEMATTFLMNVDKFTPASELAKKTKNPRSAVLSILMKAMSGQHGVAAVNAFEGKNVDSFKNSMEQVAASVTGKVAEMFKEEQSEEGEE